MGARPGQRKTAVAGEFENLAAPLCGVRPTSVAARGG
jgi:hypothetical protein